MIDLHDENSKTDIQKVMREGIQTDFWSLLIQALDENLKKLNEVLTSDALDDLSPDAYRLEVGIVRAKKKYIEELKKLPESIFLSMGSAEQTEPDDDPYYNAKDFLPKV